MNEFMVLTNVRKRRIKTGYEEVFEKNCTSFGFRQSRIYIRKCSSKFSKWCFLYSFSMLLQFLILPGFKHCADHCNLNRSQKNCKIYLKTAVQACLSLEIFLFILSVEDKTVSMTFYTITLSEFMYLMVAPLC